MRVDVKMDVAKEHPYIKLVTGCTTLRVGAEVTNTNHTFPNWTALFESVTVTPIQACGTQKYVG